MSRMARNMRNSSFLFCCTPSFVFVCKFSRLPEGIFNAFFVINDKMVFRISDDVLKEQFSILGVNISDAVLDKCREICIANSVDEEELVELWMAHSTTHLNGADPTVEFLTQMERSAFTKVSTDTNISKSAPSSSSVTVYNADTISAITGDDILRAYDTTPRGKGNSAAVNSTPERGFTKKTFEAQSPRILFSPKSFSPIVSTPSRKYASRINSGQTVSEFGNNGVEWQSPEEHLYPKISLVAPDCTVKNYMFETLQDKVSVLEDILVSVGEKIVSKNGLEEPKHIRMPEIDTFTAVGRVCCDSAGRLNPASVLLEGSRSLCSGETVYLDLQQQSSYALFPGQIIAVEGLNPSGNKIVVQKIYCDASEPLPENLPRISESDGPLHIIIAAGPYTQTDSLAYGPLEDILENIKKLKPHVAILIGPFLDMNHPHITGGLIAETFEEYFLTLIANIMENLRLTNTQVIVVPSYRDVHHQMIYPTPPYTILKKYPNLHLMPDPCIVDIQGLIIGVTSVDILLHLGKEEISSLQGSDRLSRLASHLITQQSFYPLYPVDEGINVDLDMMDRLARMKVTPHVLVVPSDLRYFIKEVNGSVVVNPERLAKGVVGGSYAHLQVSPPKPEETSCVNLIRGEILKI